MSFQHNSKTWSNNKITANSKRHNVALNIQKEKNEKNHVPDHISSSFYIQFINPIQTLKNKMLLCNYTREREKILSNSNIQLINKLVNCEIGGLSIRMLQLVKIQHCLVFLNSILNESPKAK